MKYLIALVLAVSLSLGVAILPSFADSGVSITLTTTVTGNGGGGGGFDPGNGAQVYTTPDWSNQFPTMNQHQSSSPVDSRPIQNNPPIPIPPVVTQQSNYVPPPVIPIQEPRDDSKDSLVYLFIGLGAVLVGLILYLLLPDQKVR